MKPKVLLKLEKRLKRRNINEQELAELTEIPVYSTMPPPSRRYQKKTGSRALSTAARSITTGATPSRRPTPNVASLFRILKG